MGNKFFDEIMSEIGGDRLPVSIHKEKGKLLIIIKLPRHGSPKQTVPSFNQQRQKWDDAVQRIMRNGEYTSIPVEVRYETRDIHTDKITTEFYKNILPSNY